MKRSNKLQNTKAVKQLLQGDHKFQTRTTIGYRKKEDTKKREVGEVWEEVQPNGNIIVWEQKEGYKVKTGKNSRALKNARNYIKDYPNCYKTCNKNPAESTLNEKFRISHGMCFDCVLKFEGKLKAQGKFEEYARERMYNNAQAFFEDAEKEKEVLKDGLSNISYTFVDGRSEKWGMENKESMMEKIDEDFYKLRDEILEKYKK